MKVLLKHSLLFLENQDSSVFRPLLLLSAMLIEPSNILRLVFHLQVVVCLLAWVVLEVCHLVWVELEECRQWVELEVCLRWAELGLGLGLEVCLPVCRLAWSKWLSR